MQQQSPLDLSKKKTDFFTALKSQLMQTERLLISSVEFPPVGKNYLLITITVKEAGFIHFSFKGKKSPLDYVGIYGFDENILEVKHLSPDIVFWPVYTDFNCNDWNERIKYEYAEQAKKFCEKVLYVNSLCKDKDEENIAKGGSALFINGHIIKEIAAGKEDVLLVEI